LPLKVFAAFIVIPNEARTIAPVVPFTIPEAVILPPVEVKVLSAPVMFIAA
jgi:hypothetical protein